MQKTTAVAWDSHWITRMIDQQFEMVSAFDKHQILDLLVADAFNLGYVFGFADKASHIFLEKQGTDVRNAYVLKTLSDLIGNENAGDTLFMYAQRQLEEPAFLRGYRMASRNVQQWLASSGGTTPVGLSDHLAKRSRASRMA